MNEFGLRWYWKREGFWGTLDHLAHHYQIPKWIQGWVCNRYDKALGLFDDEDE